MPSFLFNLETTTKRSFDTVHGITWTKIPGQISTGKASLSTWMRLSLPESDQRLKAASLLWHKVARHGHSSRPAQVHRQSKQTMARCENKRRPLQAPSEDTQYLLLYSHRLTRLQTHCHFSPVLLMQQSRSAAAAAQCNYKLRI